MLVWIIVLVINVLLLAAHAIIGNIFGVILAALVAIVSILEIKSRVHNRNRKN